MFLYGPVFLVESARPGISPREALACRGVKVPDRTSDIISLVKLMYDKVGDTVQPIPKAQMKGVSGWVTPEVLQMKDGRSEIQWQTKDELITLLLRSFPIIL